MDASPAPWCDKAEHEPAERDYQGNVTMMALSVTASNNAQ